MIRIFPAGKALGASGAMICCPTWFKDSMINFARPFIFSTGVSPWIAQALLMHVQWIKNQEQLRLHLSSLSRWFREELITLGFDTGFSNSHIIPVIVGSEQKSLSLQNFLYERCIIARSIRPPTVASNSCRVRFSLTADITEKNIELILESLEQWKKQSS